MSTRQKLFGTVVLCQLFSTLACGASTPFSTASSGTGYTIGQTNKTVYSSIYKTALIYPLQHCQPLPIASLLPIARQPIAQTLPATSMRSTCKAAHPMSSPQYQELKYYGIAVANANAAYAVSYNTNTVYSVNLQNGAQAPVATIPGSPGLIDIALINDTTAIVASYNNSSVYSVNLQTGASTLVATIAGSPELEGIGLANSTTAYVVGDSSDNVYTLNLETGAYSLLTPTPLAGELVGMAVDGTSGYTVGYLNNNIYVVNLLNGQSFILSTIPGASLIGFSLPLQMQTSGLIGSSEALAKYLNANATIDVIREFALLGTGLEAALESAAPTRNAFTTYASQNAYLASSQTLTDHMRQKRFHHQTQKNSKVALADIPSDELTADASNRRMKKNPAKKQPECIKPDTYTFWITPFGEYAREKAQSQVPAFHMSVGGVVAAVDYNTPNDNVVGVGAAYAYTNVHQEKGAGHGNVNQGFLTAYGTVNASEWYFDLGIWGGYYHTNNHRNIAFPGVKATAKSDTHGWQLAPHFEVGYDGFRLNKCDVKWFGVEPFLQGDWVANWEHGLRERGAGNLNMGQKGRFCSLVRGETGIRFHEIAEISWGRIVFSEKASYAYQKAFHTGSINAFLVGAPGSFSVDTLTGAQNLGVAEFSMLFVSSNPKTPYVDLRYQGEFGSRYQSHQGIVEIGKNF